MSFSSSDSSSLPQDRFRFLLPFLALLAANRDWLRAIVFTFEEPRGARVDFVEAPRSASISSSKHLQESLLQILLRRLLL